MAGKAREKSELSSRPGILIVGNFLSHAVQTRSVCEDLALHLRAEGFSVTTTSGRRSRLARLADMLGTVSRCRADYDVAQIDVFSGASFVWAEIVARRLRSLDKPMVLTLHGGNLPAFSRRWPRRMKALVGMAAAVTSPSQYLIEELRPFRDDIVLLRNPLEIGDYPFVVRDCVRPHLIWLRAFHRLYNPALAVRAFALLLRAQPTARLEMIGPDKGDGALATTRSEARSLGVSNQVSFCSGIAKSEVPKRLAKADIFLNTSLVDNAPVSVIEPMACGLCVVSTKVGGIEHLVSDGQDSLLVPSDDAKAMRAAIERLLSEPGLANRLSRAGRLRAEKFDWSIVLPQWIDLLTGVARGPDS